MFANPFPASVGFSCRRVDTVTPAQLLPEEKAHLSTRATPRRIRDFTAGRVAAREALQQLGHTSTAIPVGAARMPIFPSGFVGSISHASSHAVACAAELKTARAIGLDIEQLDPTLDVALAERIGHRSELLWLQQEPSEIRTRILTMFSAKETVYKTFYPAVREFFGYQSVLLHHDSNARHFRIEALDAKLLPHIGSDVYVPYVYAADFVLTYCLLA